MTKCVDEQVRELLSRAVIAERLNLQVKIQIELKRGFLCGLDSLS